MDLSPAPRPAIALLVDAENLSKDLAPVLLAAATRLGPPQVRRAYGNLNAVSGWEDHGFRLCPTRPGKNAADMLLCVEAMALALQGGFQTLVIASSDRDFSYLAEHLRELGKTVAGMGCDSAPASFRASCSGFTVLQPAAAPPLVRAVEKQPQTKLIPLVRAVLTHATADGGWCTAHWISIGLKRQVAGFDLARYSDRPIEQTLLALKAFETRHSDSGTALFRWPVSDRPVSDGPVSDKPVAAFAQDTP